MGIRIMHDPEVGATLYCSTSGMAFGYIANDCEGCGLTATQILASFLAYCESAEVRDVRQINRVDFEELWKDFHADEHDHEPVRA